MPVSAVLSSFLLTLEKKEMMFAAREFLITKTSRLEHSGKGKDEPLSFNTAGS